MLHAAIRSNASLAVLAALLPSAAYAAAAAAAAPVSATAVADTQDTGLQDIVVTAQKRSESINRVGLAISAFGGDALKERGVKDVAGLAKLVPGLTFAQSANNTPVYTLRGVGYYETTLAVYPTVSVYVDEVPLPFPVMTTQAGLDLERVEVLKGPQGILFGQNSTGGAINFIAAKPTDSFKGGADASYGRFNTVELNGFVSGPLTDTVKARIAVRAEHGDDWQRSYTRSDTLGKRRNLAGRLLLDWDPTDRASFELNINGWIDKSDPQAPQYTTLRLQGPPTPDLLAAIPAPHDPRSADWTPDLGIKGNEKMYQFALRGTYDFGGVTLTSITSYIDYRRRNIVDLDGLPLRNQDLTNNNGDIRTFSQELRLSNGGNPGVRWVVGANYERSKTKETGTILYGDSSVTPLLGISETNFFSNQNIRNYAAFGNVEYDLLTDLTIKAGLRYNDSTRTNEACNLDTGDGKVAALFSSLSSNISGVPHTFAPGDCVLLRHQDYRPAGLFTDKLKEDNLSWRVGLDYRASRDVLLFANVARGYKAGSYPAAPASTTLQYQPVVQEKLTDYEAGFKASLFNRSLRVEGAAFHYDYTNKQIRSLIIDLVFGAIPALVNVPKSTVDGGELSVAWKPMRGLELSTGATYLDAKVKRYVGVNGAGQAADFAGDRVPYTPKWLLTGSGDYGWDVASGLRASVGATAAYNSATNAVIGGDDLTRVKSFATLDLRASIEGGDGLWKVAVWGRNVTNTYYWSNVVQNYDTIGRYAAKPRTYGVAFSSRF
jgi:outer membrane receptor protein involved in Fe transport